MFLQVTFSVPPCTARGVILYRGYILFTINGVNGQGCDSEPNRGRVGPTVQIGHVMYTRAPITKCLWRLHVLYGCDSVVVHVDMYENFGQSRLVAQKVISPRSTESAVI